MIYKLESATPILGPQNIKILKIMTSFFDSGITTTTKDREAKNSKNSFAQLVTVEYHTIRSSRIRMGNLDVSTNDYFKRKGSVFTGPDGKEYLWKLGEKSCEARTSEMCEDKADLDHLSCL